MRDVGLFHAARGQLMVPRFARAAASRPQLPKLAQHARWNLDDRVLLQVRSALPGLVGKRLGDVRVDLECLLGLSLAAGTSAGGPDPTQQSAWRPVTPLRHGLQPECRMTMSVLT